jgi:hypothetical protein
MCNILAYDRVLSSAKISFFCHTIVGQESITDKKTGEARGPFHVATHVKIKGAGDIEYNFDLEELSIDKLWTLAKKLGIKGYCSVTKFQCHQLIGKHVIYQQAYNNDISETSATSVQKKLVLELQKVQAFFHPEIFEQIMKINSLKDRSDHENGTGEKQTWSALADLYNNTDSDPNLDEIDYMCQFDQQNHLINNSGYEDLNLEKFTSTVDNGTKMKKFFTGMFKLRQEIKHLMTTVSGTHNNNLMAFVNKAKAKVKTVYVHRLALYYFFVKCKEFPQVDDEIASSLPEEMTGSSHNRPPSEILMTPSAGASVATSKSSVKKLANTNDFLDASVQAFKDIAATVRQKHSTDKMFCLLAMDGVSPNTKKNIQDALLQEFRTAQVSVPLAKRAKTTPLDGGIDKYRSMSHIHHLIVAEDYVCGTTVNSDSNDKDSSVTKDPDSVLKLLLS